MTRNDNLNLNNCNTRTVNQLSALFLDDVVLLGVILRSTFSFNCYGVIIYIDDTKFWRVIMITLLYSYVFQITVCRLSTKWSCVHAYLFISNLYKWWLFLKVNVRKLVLTKVTSWRESSIKTSSSCRTARAREEVKKQKQMEVLNSNWRMVVRFSLRSHFLKSCTLPEPDCLWPWLYYWWLSLTVVVSVMTVFYRS